MEFTRNQAFRTFLALPRAVHRRQRRRKNAKDDRSPTEAELNADARKYVGCMPPDVMLEIVDHLSPIDILNFSLTSSYVRDILMPALYETILLKSSRKCLTTLPLLLTRPEIARHVRKLAVRPNYYLAWPKPDEPIEEEWVANQIMLIAESGSFNLLHTFDWDGLEMPKDELWTTLQRCCPQLRTVFSNVGYKPLDPDSKLFDFKALTSFSLIVRHGLGGADLFPSLEKLPPKLWSMLFHSCPDLTELTLCSFSSSARLFDVHSVSQGRWPKLHTLTLGSFGYQADFSLTAPAGTPVGLGGAAFSLGSVPTITTTSTTTIPTSQSSSLPASDVTAVDTTAVSVSTNGSVQQQQVSSPTTTPISSSPSPSPSPPPPTWNPSDVHQHVQNYLTQITTHPQTTVPFDAGLPAEHAFAHFLLAHTTLTYLRLSWNFKRWMSPESIPMYLPGGVKVDVVVNVPPVNAPSAVATGASTGVSSAPGAPISTNQQTGLTSTSTSSLGSITTIVPANAGIGGSGAAMTTPVPAVDGPSYVTTTTVTPISSAVALAAQPPNATGSSSSFSSSVVSSTSVTSSFSPTSPTSPSSSLPTMASTTTMVNPWNHTQTYTHHHTLLSLPNLTTFVGVYQQLAEMPSHTLEKIESVDLTCEPVYESRLASVAGVLKKLKGLKTLDIWMHVPNGGGGGVLGGWGDMIGLGGLANGGANNSNLNSTAFVEDLDGDEQGEGDGGGGGDETMNAAFFSLSNEPSYTPAPDSSALSSQNPSSPDGLSTLTVAGDSSTSMSNSTASSGTTATATAVAGGNNGNTVAGPSNSGSPRRRRSQFVGSRLSRHFRSFSISSASTTGGGAAGDAGGNGGNGNGNINANANANGGGGLGGAGAGGNGGGNGGGGGGGGGHPEDRERESEEDEGNRVFFKTILQSVPTLEELHFMCTTAFAVKPLNQLASLLYLLPNLKVFSLTKGHKYRDETMLQSATRVLKVRPGLKQVNIRWAREKSPNHLKQEGSYEVVARRKVSLPSASSTPSHSPSASMSNSRRASIASVRSLAPSSSSTLTPIMNLKGKGKAREDSSASSSSLSPTTPPPSASLSSPTSPGSPPRGKTQQQQKRDSRWEYEILEIQATERGIPLIGTPFLRKFKLELKVRVKRKHVLSSSMSAVPSYSMSSSMSTSTSGGLGWSPLMSSSTSGLSTSGQEDTEATGLASPIVLTTDGDDGDDALISPGGTGVRRRWSFLQFVTRKTRLGGGTSSTGSASSSKNRWSYQGPSRSMGLEPSMSSADEDRAPSQSSSSRIQSFSGGEGSADDVEHQPRPSGSSLGTSPRPKSLDLGTLGVMSQVIGEVQEEAEGEFNPYSSEDSQREVGKELYENSSIVWPADAAVGVGVSVVDGNGHGLGAVGVGASASATGRREPSIASTMPPLGIVDLNGVD